MRNDFDSTPRLVKTAKPVVAPSPLTEPAPVAKKKPRIPKEFKDIDKPGQAPKGTFPYWVVWNRHRYRMPGYRHPSEASAVTEAHRLALLEPRRKFYIARVESFVAEYPVHSSEPSATV